MERLKEHEKRDRLEIEYYEQVRVLRTVAEVRPVTVYAPARFPRLTKRLQPEQRLISRGDITPPPASGHEWFTTHSVLAIMLPANEANRQPEGGRRPEVSEIAISTENYNLWLTIGAIVNKGIAVDENDLRSIRQLTIPDAEQMIFRIENYIHENNAQTLGR